MSTLNSQQICAIEHLNRWRVGALFMEAGTGKTRAACELVNSVKDLDYILWIGPLRTLGTGPESVLSEVQRYGDINSDIIRFVGIESIQQSDRIFLDVLNEIRAHANAFLVVDESIKIKNLDAKRTKRAIAIGDYAKYKLILNGTPLTRNILDIYAQMYFLSPSILNMSYAKFKNTFCKYTTIRTHSGRYVRQKEYITGYENIDYLYSLIGNYVYQCNLDLGISVSYSTIQYSIGEAERKQYSEIKRNFLDMDTLSLRNNNIFMEMTQKMQHAYSETEDKFAKVDELFTKIDESSTIIFCKYISSREACEKRYPRAKVLSYQKDSFGLNLQHYHNTIYFDKVWDLALRTQSLHRTFRTGQMMDCKYFDLTGNIGLERLIDKNIGKKISMTEYFKMASKKDLEEDL